MLTHLYIKNFALIDELNIDFHPGFSVITGETGAGKSIVLGAIGLLLGQRADTKAIKSGEKKCTIEAHFDLSNYSMDAFFCDNDIDYDPSDCIVRRELTQQGKSRAFINDTPASLALLKQLGEQLIDIHLQHQNLLLQKADFQLNVVDIIANNGDMLHSYRELYETYRQKASELLKLKEQIAAAKENEDFMRFQLSELTAAQLSDGLQEQLEQENETLTHSEEIKTALYTTDALFNADENGILEQLSHAITGLQSIASVYPQAKDYAARLSSASIEIKDIAADISASRDSVDFDPARLEEISQRLDTIYTLEQKYHVSTVADLLSLQHSLEEKLRTIDHGDEQLSEMETHVEECRQRCTKQASLLTASRLKAARRVEEAMKERLVPLGIPSVRFQVDISSKSLQADGADAVRFLFSANKSSALQPVAEVASGGEIARVMLSLKAMISGAVKLPTIIFDEIDTGVSGKTAQQMAAIMAEMGKNHRQVISITHLPQIAAMGSHHYKVEKEETVSGTTSRMRELSAEERVAEIAQMLSGSCISEAAMSNARELLGM